MWAKLVIISNMDIHMDISLNSMSQSNWTRPKNLEAQRKIIFLEKEKGRERVRSRDRKNETQTYREREEKRMS